MRVKNLDGITSTTKLSKKSYIAEQEELFDYEIGLVFDDETGVYWCYDKEEMRIELNNLKQEFAT